MRKNNKHNGKSKGKLIREIIEEYVKRTEKPELSEIVNLIKPFYIFEKDDLVNRALKSKARSIMRKFVDSDGVRIYFLDNSGTYINIVRP